MDVRVTELLAAKDAEIRRLERERHTAQDEVTRLSQRVKTQAEQLHACGATIKSTEQRKQERERESRDLQVHLSQRDHELELARATLSTRHEQVSASDQR